MSLKEGQQVKSTDVNIYMYVIVNDIIDLSSAVTSAKRRLVTNLPRPNGDW